MQGMSLPPASQTDRLYRHERHTQPLHFQPCSVLRSQQPFQTLGVGFEKETEELRKDDSCTSNCFGGHPGHSWDDNLNGKLIPAESGSSRPIGMNRLHKYSTYVPSSGIMLLLHGQQLLFTGVPCSPVLPPSHSAFLTFL